MTKLSVGSSLPTELWKWDAVDLACEIRRGAVSSTEVVKSCLDRLDRVDPKVNSVVVPTPEAALKAAEAADAAVARGDTFGALHGVPVTIKINVDQVGEASSDGVVAFRNNIATEDSPVVANLKSAGAVIIGRTNTPTFSFRAFTHNELHGHTMNPWSEAHTPGGSSGGAATSVAVGIAPIGHGNDISGSIRYPAYCTGVAGLRPSFGRVPAFQPSAKRERPLSGQLFSVQGPLARHIRDISLALEVMAKGIHEIRGGCRHRCKGRRCRSESLCRSTLRKPASIRWLQRRCNVLEGCWRKRVTPWRRSILQTFSQSLRTGSKSSGPKPRITPLP